MSTSVSSLTSNFFPSAQNGFTTTTSGSVASGANTVGLNSVAGYSNGEIAVFVIEPTEPTKKQTFTGVIDTSGVQVTNVVWTAGTNQTHAAGVTVVDYESATHFSMITKGLLVQHKQDGTHANTITTDTINENTSANGVTIDGLNIKDSKLNTNASVIPNNLVASTGTSWAWQSWSPSYTNLTVGSGTVTAKYVQVGKLVICRFKFVFGSGSAVGGEVSIDPPVAINSEYSVNSTEPLGPCNFLDSGTALFSGVVAWGTGGKLQPRVNAAGGTFTAPTALSSTVPMTWATGDTMMFTATYETT